MANFSRLGMTEFKNNIGAESISVVKNPHTGKLFASASNGQSFKVQGDLDLSGPVEWLIPKEGINEACLINKGRGENVLATF